MPLWLPVGTRQSLETGSVRNDQAFLRRSSGVCVSSSVVGITL